MGSADYPSVEYHSGLRRVREAEEERAPKEAFLGRPRLACQAQGGPNIPILQLIGLLYAILGGRRVSSGLRNCLTVTNTGHTIDKTSPLPLTHPPQIARGTHFVSPPCTHNSLTFHDDNLNVCEIASALEGLSHLLPEVVSFLQLEQHGLIHKPTP